MTDERAMMVLCPKCGASQGNNCLSAYGPDHRCNSITGRIMQHRARIDLAVRTIKIEHWRREQAIRALAEEPGDNYPAARRPFVVPNQAWIGTDPRSSRLINASPDNAVARAMIAAGVTHTPMGSIVLFRAEDWYLAVGLWQRIPSGSPIRKALTAILQRGRAHAIDELERMRALEALG